MKKNLLVHGSAGWEVQDKVGLVFMAILLLQLWSAWITDMHSCAQIV